MGLLHGRLSSARSFRFIPTMKGRDISSILSRWVNYAPSSVSTDSIFYRFGRGTIYFLWLFPQSKRIFHRATPNTLPSYSSAWKIPNPSPSLLIGLWTSRPSSLSQHIPLRITVFWWGGRQNRDIIMCFHSRRTAKLLSSSIINL